MRDMDDVEAVIDSPSTQRGLSRRELLRRTAIAGAGGSIAALLAACNSSTTSASGQGNFPSHPKWKFAFVNHVTTNPFFVPTQYGIQDASALLGTDFQWTGSETADNAQMVNAMNAAIAAKVDGIAVCIVNDTAFDEPTDKALAAGIPVVSYNADRIPGSKNNRLAYIGQDLYGSGFAMGQRIVKAVGSGPVVGFIATPGQGNIQPRIDGAKAAINQLGKGAINFTQIATGAKVEDELSAIEAYYLGHKDVKGMYAVDAGSTQGTGQIMQKYGLAAKGVHAGGYDLLPKTLELVKSGDLDFTIDQQPYLQGFYPVVLLFLYKLSGGLSGPAEMNTGLLFVTKSTVDPYMASKSRFEGSSSAQKVVTK
jgi:simple sugar transport system substrate-binding protein